MGRTAKKLLTARQVNSEFRLGYHADGPHTGLYLQVARGQHGLTRSWIYRYTSPTLRKRREIGLGSVGIRGLADARALAADYRLMVLDGKDPKDERDRARHASAVARARQLTFDDAAAQCIKAKEPEWRNAKHAQQWRNTLTTYVSPQFGSVPVDLVTIAHVHKALSPIWTTKTETAGRLRQRIEAVLDWAKAGSYRTGDNPASLKGGLGELLPKAAKVKRVEHHAALPYQQVNGFVRALRCLRGVGPLAFEFMILTATRTNEVIGAKWDEFDLQAKLWTIPAGRMKTSKEHVVPLSRRAAEILETMLKAGSNEYVFPSHSRAGTRSLSNGVFLAIMKKMAGFEAYTPHGMRSTFRDWAGETTSFPREVIEHAMAHQLPDKAEAAYARGTLLRKRAKLMQQWQLFVGLPIKPGTVTPIKARIA